MLSVRYYHPVVGGDGKRYSTANIIWAKRDRGDTYYRVSKFGMNRGKFPADHPCAPFDKHESNNRLEMGDSPALRAFRERGYWASCFPEGDGITLKWWGEPGTAEDERSAEQVVRDVRECFGWDVRIAR